MERVKECEMLESIVCRAAGLAGWLCAWGISLALLGMLAGCAPPAAVSPPRMQVVATQSAQPFRAKVETFDGDFTITFVVNPGQAGENEFIAFILDNQTHKMAIDIAVTLYTTMQDMAMGTEAVVLHADGGGQFSATSETLSMSGHWAIGLTVQTNDRIIHRAGVRLLLP